MRVVWFQWSLAAMSHELVHGSNSRATIISSSLAGVLTSCGRSRFKTAVGVSILCHRDTVTLVETLQHLDDCDRDTQHVFVYVSNTNFTGAEC